MANATELPNPSTPLAFLPPALASQIEVWRYVIAGTSGAYVWDVGLNLGNDYTLLFKHRIRFPTIVYFLSRAFTLAYILSYFIFAVALVENCNAFALAMTISGILTQSTTAMLFLLRVTAVWHPNKITYTMFSILWLAVLGAGLTGPLGMRRTHIGPTKQCIDTVIPGDIEATGIAPLINDTAIFFAINYRILAHTNSGGFFHCPSSSFLRWYPIIHTITGFTSEWAALLLDCNYHTYHSPCHVEAASFDPSLPRDALSPCPGPGQCDGLPCVPED
ncbi:hypothetical protein MSAN_02316000 [Mycena sanguinolenta]|uniref:Uncharacterized protein n=1 Tax=Mycena sanguinolenta TaxID=230812 RepID=A0A8H6X7T2_9AGAR|nr:hypothetical protein MSAN_02316000 [Mycena sanguinolenta]